MRNTNLIRVANIVSVAMVFMLLLTPLLVDAQFEVPDPANPRGTGQDTKLPSQAKISEIIVKIIQILLAIAGLVAIVFLIVGGFQYITAGGNEERAEAAKKTITNAIIGIVIIILSFVIVRVISNAFLPGGAGV